MTKDGSSDRAVRVARLTIRAAARCVAAYGSIKSRKDFTQRQHLACLVLKSYFRTDYRGICEILRLSPTLREAIGLTRVPHFTTLQKFMNRPGVVEIVDAMIGRIIEELGLAEVPAEIAVDSTGMQNGVASLHYNRRRRETGGVTARKSVKISLALICGAMLPVAMVVDLGSSADMKQMPALMEQIGERSTPS